MISNQCMFMFGLFESFYSIFIKHMSTPPWFLPFRISVPFSTANLRGWYSLWFIQFNIGLAFSFGMITMTSYFIGCCLYINAVCDHVELIIQETKASAQRYQSEINPWKHEKRYTEIKGKLSQALEMHVNVLE